MAARRASLVTMQPSNVHAARSRDEYRLKHSLQSPPLPSGSVLLPCGGVRRARGRGRGRHRERRFHQSVTAVVTRRSSVAPGPYPPRPPGKTRRPPGTGCRRLQRGVAAEGGGVMDELGCSFGARHTLVSPARRDAPAYMRCPSTVNHGVPERMTEASGDCADASAAAAAATAAATRARAGIVPDGCHECAARGGRRHSCSCYWEDKPTSLNALQVHTSRSCACLLRCQDAQRAEC
jgi:hypothetical protein